MQSSSASVLDGKEVTAVAERNAVIESVFPLIRGLVTKHCRHFGGDRHDLFQECVMLLCKSWRQYDASESAFTTWTHLLCTRHLRQTRALGRLYGPIVRVSITEFYNGNRVRVTSIDQGDYQQPLECKTKPAVNVDDFILFAESLVGRKIEPLEQGVLVDRFIHREKYEAIALKYNREFSEIRNLVATYIRQAKRRHDNYKFSVTA